MRKEALRVSHLYKRIGQKEVLTDFHMNLLEGETLGIMGLKGSGKTLLFHILTGKEEFDQGTLFFNEKRVDGKRWCCRNQIAMVGRESQLQQNMSIADNIFYLRKHYHHQIWTHKNKMEMRTKKELQNVGINLSPDTLICQLTRLESYMIEIVKRYIMGAKVIILDDFSEQYRTEEILKLNQLLDRMKQDGISFIISGYRLKNLQMCAERILFLVNGTTGKIVQNMKRNQIDENLIFQIFPSALPRRKKAELPKSEVLFSARDVSVNELEKATFDLHKGEILTIVDFETVHNENLFHCLMNPESILQGRIVYDHHPITRKDYAAKNNGILFADFNLENKIIEQMSLQDNLCMGNFNKVSRVGFYSKRSMEFIKKDFLEWYPSEQLKTCRDCRNLSEKDKMAILLYRIRMKKPRVILCNEPGRYTDALTFEMMRKQFWDLAESGTSILILTQNIEQNYMLTDRFLFWDRQGLKEFSVDTILFQNKIQN